MYNIKQEFFFVVRGKRYLRKMLLLVSGFVHEQIVDDAFFEIVHQPLDVVDADVRAAVVIDHAAQRNNDVIILLQEAHRHHFPQRVDRAHLEVVSKTDWIVV